MLMEYLGHGGDANLISIYSIWELDENSHSSGGPFKLTAEQGDSHSRRMFGFLAKSSLSIELAMMYGWYGECKD